MFCAARRRFYRGNRKLGRFARTEGDFSPWPDYYPGFSLLLDLWKENSDLEVIRQYFEQYKQTSLDWDKAGLLLDKSRYFNRCAAIEDIYRLLG